MRVSYKLDGAGGSYITLFDSAAGTTVLEDFHPSFQGVVQQVPLPGSDDQFREPRGNITCSFAFKFNTQYASNALAVASILTMASLMGQKLHIQVVEGATTHYYPNAAAAAYDGRPCGVSVDHNISFQSDTVTTAAP